MHQIAPERPLLRGACPIDLRPLDPVPVLGEAEVQGAVLRARAAQSGWAALDFEERAKRIKKAARRMLEDREEVIELLRSEVGKYSADVLMSEALGPLDYLSQWIDIVRPALETQKLPINPIAFPGKRGSVEIVPRGVIGVIAPWNFPLAYFFKPVFPALLSGNAVLIKPSEHAPRTAAWFVDHLAAQLPRDVIQCVTGGAETGRVLIRSGIDALTFTGSVKTGREVLLACAEQMIPVSVELGGKDPAIVLPDCNLERTVAGIMNWAFTNAGQSCSAIERIYVLDAIADRFVPMLADAVGRLTTRPRKDGSVDVGPLVTAAQLELVEAQVADALAKGAKLLAGGARSGVGHGYQPTVLDRVNHGMRVATEETFGPLVAVIRVPTVDEAVRLANDSIYGLNASVWSQDLEEANRIAHRLEAGVVLINNHSVTGAMPAAPWTGVKQTGFGVANSSHALATFTRPKTFLTDRGKAPDPWWLPMDHTLEEIGSRLAEAQLGKFWKALKVPLLLNRRAKKIVRFVKNEDWTLSKIEREWGAQVFEALYPRSADPRYFEKTRDVDDLADLEEIVQAVPPMTALGFRAGVLIHGIAPIFVLKKLATFDQLSPEERQTVVERLAKHPNYLVRQISFLMKASGALSHARTSHLRAVPEV